MTQLNIYDFVKDKADFVFAQLGPSYSENTYRRALSAEFRCNPAFLVQEEYGIPVFYRTSVDSSVYITTVKVDILLTEVNTGETVVIELKKLSRNLTPATREYAQMMRYAHLINANHKCLINFTNDSVQMLT